MVTGGVWDVTCTLKPFGDSFMAMFTYHYSFFFFRLHKLVTSRQQDKESMSNLEKKLSEEKKQRSQFEQQLSQEKKAKKEREAAAATALANANR